MKIKTTRFGEIESEDKLIFDFSILPILGYNNEKQFVMIESKEASLFKWIQSTQTPELAFPVTAPSFFGVDYVFELPDDAERALEVKTAEELLVLNIAKIPAKNPRATTINLLAPLIFNVSNNKAGQVILTGTNFDVKYPLFQNNENSENKEDESQESDEKKEKGGD